MNIFDQFLFKKIITHLNRKRNYGVWFQNTILIISLIFIISSKCFSQNTSITKYVNPIIGAVTYSTQTKDIHGFGKTFPGACTPYGLVQLSPDTKTGGDNAPGYSWNNNTIEGFSFTHMSGTGWYGDLGNFLVTPTIGKLFTNRGDEKFPDSGYRSRFSHDDEKVEAGYYSVLLSDYKIRVELSATAHAGIIRFTFPQSDSSRIQIDLSRRVGGTSTEQFVKIEDDNTISGWMKCPSSGGGWGNGDGNVNYTLYFWCQFSKPLKNYGVWSANIPNDWIRKNNEVASKEYQDLVANADIFNAASQKYGKHIGFFTDFKTEKDEKVLLKCGISFVSVKNAKDNLENEIPDWNFNKVRNDANNLWNKELSRITVTGGTENEKTIFYTALYHTMIDPRIFSDTNGQYIGADEEINVNKDFTFRTLFSGWDVFRSQFPLQTIINPELVNDEINSLLQIAELSGKEYLPRWEFFNAYTNCMIGNPAISIITDAYEKGIRNYDIDKAFKYSQNTINKFGNGSLGYTENTISQTLEYAYSDWCFARFAESLGKNQIAEKYYKKSKNYKNIWNDEVNWFRGKDALGEWRKWEGKTFQGGWDGQGCVESNPLQQGWFVPHDLLGLAELMGGKQIMLKELITFFENTPKNFLWNDYYNHANEPVHHVSFIFNVLGQPYLTQKWSRKICDKAYGTDAFGLCGNEDMGQMSAWYVLAAIGLYPICPGDNKYQITSPVFSKIEIMLDDQYYKGKKFTIIARNNSKVNIYIQSIKLNGKQLNRYWITHQEITNGGVLEIEMGRSPKVEEKK